MYTQLIEQAVKRLRGEEVEEEITPEIRWNKPAFIPDDYVESPHQRLSIYKRLAAIQSDEDVEEMRLELQDRYGAVPTPVSNLLEVMRIKPLLGQMRVKVFDFNGKRIVLTLDRSTKIEPARIVDLANRSPDCVRFTPGFSLRVKLREGGDINQMIRNLFEILTSKDDRHVPRTPLSDAREIP
jgi:transcription-repair coupling factor (superfamily II helicase)